MKGRSNARRVAVELAGLALAYAISSPTEVTGKSFRTHNRLGKLATCESGIMSFSGSKASRADMNWFVAMPGGTIRICVPSVGPFVTRSMPMLAPRLGRSLRSLPPSRALQGDQPGYARQSPLCHQLEMEPRTLWSCRMDSPAVPALVDRRAQDPRPPSLQRRSVGKCSCWPPRGSHAKFGIVRVATVCILMLRLARCAIC
jgi:hypothetical protein